MIQKKDKIKTRTLTPRKSSTKKILARKRTPSKRTPSKRTPTKIDHSLDEMNKINQIALRLTRSS